MAKISTSLIKQLREKTKAGVMDCRQALEECRGDCQKAEKWLQKKGIESATKRANRETTAGLIETYSHADGKIVAVVELNCETDFVARNEEFKKLAHELAMQMAAMKPKNVSDLLKQPWIRDDQQTIGELVKTAVGKLGENIVIGRIARFELGETES